MCRKVQNFVVEHGSDAVLPEIPARAGYYKERWDNDGKNIVEDTVIRAIYNKIPTAVVIDGTDVPERDEEAEVNPSTGAPVMNVLPAFAVICAAAFLGKRK